MTLMKLSLKLIGTSILLSILLIKHVFAADAAVVDNGTDPTKFSKIAEAKYEQLALNGGIDSNTLRL